MKHFWALPAVLRPALVLASQTAFSVYDDILAFPQYEVHFSEDHILEERAQSILKNSAQSETDTSADVEHYTRRTNNDARDDDDGTDKGDSVPLDYEMMIHNDQRYLCSIPQVDKPVDKTKQNDTLSKAEQERELARANDRGWELLAGMQGNCVYYMSGWWSYRFCYNQDVKQFHQLPPSRGTPPFPPVEDPNVQAYYLGRYDEKKAKQHWQEHRSEDKWEGEGALEISEHATRMTGGQGELVTRGQSKYLAQKLEDGTECDLTGKPRVIEVQYHCNPSIGSDRIILIKETTTCAYLMVVHTARLCDDVAFFPPQKDEANSISCRPILRPEEAENYEHNQKLYKSALKEAQIWEENPEAAAIFGMTGEANYEPPLQIVGDIIIGAREMIPDGVEIEKSGIAGGRGKDKYIDTIANSWGKDLSLSKDDLERLGLQGEKSLENLKKLKKELKKAAKEENWRLDVVDTPNGREFRGIYGSDVQEEDPESKSKQGKKESAATGEGKKQGEASGEKAQDQQRDGDQGSEGQQGSQEEYYKEEL